MKNEQCEFCGKEADTEGTSMTGIYCVDCLRLVRAECLAAIRKIQKRTGREKSGTRTTKQQFDDAFNNLLHPPTM